MTVDVTMKKKKYKFIFKRRKQVLFSLYLCFLLFSEAEFTFVRGNFVLPKIFVGYAIFKVPFLGLHSQPYFSLNYTTEKNMIFR